MITFEYTYDNVAQMAERFDRDFNGADAQSPAFLPADYLERHSSVLLTLQPGDMTRYQVGVQYVRYPDLVGLSLYSPYQRCAIVPVDAYGDYLLDKLRIPSPERDYPGLRTILETVLQAVSRD